MVHSRSPVGAWKHAQRRFLRGYLARPPVFYGVELPPPPPPPVFYGVELPGPRVRVHWDDLLEEVLDSSSFGDAVEEENDLPMGSWSDTQYFVDAPFTAKDVSLPKTLCLDLLWAAVVPETSFAPPASFETDARTVAMDVLKIELEELKGVLASMRTDFQNDET